MQEVDETWMDKLLRQGEEKGLAQGQIEGKRAALLAQLRQKFGALPDAVTARIASLDRLEDLDRLLARVLTASNLEEMKLDS